MTERLLQPSLCDERGIALDPLIERLSRLDVSALLVYAVDHVTPTALPHLIDQFHLMGLEGYDWATTDAERRALVKSAIADHRLKGTLAGLRRFGARGGVHIVRAVVPPAKVYCAPTLTRAERDEFLARYPQLRLYRYRTRGLRLVNGWYLDAAYVAGTQYPVITDAVLRLGWRSFLWHTSGAETALTCVVREVARAQADAALDVSLRKPGSAGFGTYPGRQIPRSYLVTQDGGGRLFNVHLDTPYRDFDETVHAVAATPGLAPIDIRYSHVAQRWLVHGVMFRRHIAGHLVDNLSRDRLYRRFHLFDPAVDVPRRGKSTHIGAMKLGMPAYTAELRTSMPARWPARLFGRYAAGYWASAGVSRLERGRQTLANAAAWRDRVWLDTHDFQTVRSGYGATAGRYRAGQVISLST